MEKLSVNLGIYRIAIADFNYSGISRSELPARVMWKFGTNALANLEQKKLGILFTAMVQVSEESSPFLKLAVEMTFEFDDMPNYVSDQKEVKIPSELQSAIIGIVISTARGILFAKMLGTPLEGMILPIIDPQQLAPKTPIKTQIGPD